MPATEITEATRPVYVITMAAVADIMIAARVVVMIVGIMDMVVAMVIDADMIAGS
jgi:hypothetical protein